MSEVTSEGFLKVAHASAPSGTLPRSQSELENDRVLALISRASASAPPALAVYLKQAAPAIALMWKFINLVAPLYVAMWAMCVRVYKTLPLELLEALMGLGMCFAGGAYCTSIAAVEAFRLTGWQTTRRALQDVYAEAKNVQAAHAADDKKDDDRDGKPDVLALAPAELLQRKVKVLALAVKDPDKMMAALGGLYTSWLAVQGTLRLQYAKTITLGVSIANELEKPAMSWLVPIAVPLIPPAYHHWIPTIIRVTIKSVAVFIAWQLQIIISAVQSAIRGGRLAARKTLSYCDRHGYIQVADVDGLAEVIGYTLAVLGFYTQWQWGFGLPFPLNLIMFPFTLIEWYIRYTVTG